MNPAGESTADREVVSSRLFAPPREAVYAAFRNPARLAQWWGPNGFTNTMREFDLRAGGAWHITMHGPGGADYHNESRFIQVEPPGLIVFEHLGPVHWYRMTMTFAAEGTGTRLTWRMVFASAEECAKVRKFIVEGNDKKRARLNCIDHLLKQMPYEEVPHEEITLPERVFNPEYERQTLPRELYVPEKY